MNARTLTLLALVASPAPACIYVDDTPYYDPYIYEVEPNDFFWSAQGIGPVSVGEQILLRGHIDDFGFDNYDGFAFQSTVPMDIEFALYSDNPNADFDVALFDPYTLSTVATWETGLNPETGRFSVWSSGFEFHLVVSSFFGSGDYTLEVRGKPLTWFGDGSNGLTAQSLSGRAERAIDWKKYAGRSREEDAAASEPEFQITTLKIDPATGRVDGVRVQRVPRRAWLEHQL